MGNKTFDVFVSYARTDARHAVDIVSVLRAQGLVPFFDRSDLPPGLPWVRRLEVALNAAKAAIILIGPHGLGNTQQYERDLAIYRQTRDPSFPIVPVILPEAEIDRPFNFLNILTWLDFSHVSKVSDAPAELEHLVAAVRGEQLSSAESVREAICPYRGLDAFREEDSMFFFGRGTADDPESAIGQLVSKVREHPFVMVVGRSGSGKSSLVYAGLVPALRRARDRFWNVLTLRPGSEPIEALAMAFNPQANNEGNAKYSAKIGAEADQLRTGDPELLSRMIRRELDRSEGKPDRLLLYIDQWEELYAQAPSQSVERADRHIADVNRFIDLLLNAAQSAPVSVVATVRADFYDPLIGHQKIQALLPTQQVLLSSMSRADLESTIVEPAKIVKLSFDPPNLVSRILDEAGENEGMLPLLQYALKETWALREGNVMTGAAYARSGGVREAIRITAERTFNALSPGDQKAARQLFLSLVTPGEGQEDTRARAAMPADPIQRRIVDQFAGPRTRLLVTGSDRAARPTVEVAHEALIRTWPRLREWINANREKLRARAAVLQAKAEWEQQGRREDLLLPAGFQLERARALLAEPGDLKIDDIREFICASEEEAEARLNEQRRQREHVKQVEAIAAAQAGREAALHEAGEALKKAADAQRMRARIRNLALVVVSILAGLAGWLGFNAQQQRMIAEQQRRGSEEILARAKTIISNLQDRMDEKTKEEVFALFTAGAKTDNATAKFNLGLLYSKGEGVGQDYSKAREWWEKAAANGNATAMFNLGLVYSKGEGVGQDYSKAREWWEKAAANGSATAMFNLGLLYSKGEGVVRDRSKAREWWEKAAANGDVGAKKALELQQSIDNSLATRAKQDFHARMEPGIPKLNLSNILDARRDLFSNLRDYVRGNFDAAVDALVGEATTEESARAVEHALRVFNEAGQTSESDALFADMIERSGTDARARSVALRYSVGLAELPAALASLTEAPFVAPFGRTGDKALPAFTRAADLDPNDAWTWIVVALKAPAKDAIDQALLQATRSAQAQRDWPAVAFVLQVAGLALELRGRPMDADRAYADAVQVARNRRASIPFDDVEASRELARNLLWFGSVKARRDGEVVQARTVLEEALRLREAAAQRRPDDMRETIDLISSHLQLNVLFHENGLSAEAKEHLDTALRLYGAMADRSQFVPTLAVGAGLMSEILLIAGALTLVAGFVLLALYRWRMRALMRAAAKAPVVPQSETSPDDQGAGVSAIPIRFVGAAPQASPPRSGPLEHAAMALRQASWVYALAGGAFAAIASLLLFRLGDVEFGYVRGAIFLLAWGWPIVLVLHLLWGQDNRRLGVLLGVYLGLLAGVCLIVALGDTPPLEVGGVTVAPFFVPLIFWGLTVLPALFLVSFLLRGIRSVGPVLLVFMIFAMCGAAAGTVAVSTLAGMKVVVAILVPLGLFSAWAAVLLAAVIGMALFAPLGWIAVDLIRRGYEAKYFSDASIVFASIWLFQTLSLFGMLFHSSGYAAWAALGAFAGYSLVAWLCLRPLAAAATRRQPARLLLLRVFGFQRRTERLFDLLSARWRFAGPIALIAAPDLASRSIDPSKLLAFVGGRLKQRFIIEPTDLDQRIQAVDDRPQSDGSYRVEEFFCGKDMWQPAVLSLMANCDLVTMDLRGFSPNNKGCVFELQSLVACVPVGKIMLLTDATTDVAFLRETLDICWRATRSRSTRAEPKGSLILLDTKGRDLGAVDTLMALADQALGQPASIRESGRASARFEFGA